ncbi:hypothetical protein AGABI1DRAFT_131795 [Agaricus bisporus var. burnettii JB137-S8]|uniref:Uncharacterized protein n=1 Tax=Agaricus bisporus var. burnettii (strain JB137-S8 / ATCC MYA-4627 / FGSC 10392) TaxID=597362 RepID=K5WYH8_AGABU|nr:uncharacterized protein AGABI1DRAFT_131795 [Agaricus bisporus var. burnettii JB137-S8]EKM75888.1 hypothetical protein AGABI1DRAFT_131795 [Agaricus bisporus var. burnettii JB137-S8]
MALPDTPDDIMSAKELANLLGRELVQAKGRILGLEKQLQDKNRALKQLQAKQPDKRAPRIPDNVAELQKEIDRYKETEAKLQNKVKGLKGQVAQMVDKDKKIKSLKDQVANLRSQQERAREEAERSKTMYIEEKQIREELLKTIEGKEKSTGKWDDILSTMAALPFCSARPEHRTLAPVAKVGVQLCQYLRSDPRTREYADAILFMPGQMTWCPSARGHHHALAFAPTHIFDTQSRRWEKKIVMEQLFGRTLELFFQEKTDVLYAGTYKCLRLKSSKIDSWPGSEIEGLLPYNMAGIALSDDFTNAPCSSVHKSTISKLYHDRVLPLECMGLQCVGFKQEFYESLVARHHSNLPAKRRRQSENVIERSADKKTRR